jgi:hypothetical protein
MIRRLRHQIKVSKNKIPANSGRNVIQKLQLTLEFEPTDVVERAGDVLDQVRSCEDLVRGIAVPAAHSGQVAIGVAERVTRDE